jgi:sulfur carrier protein ThiS adenylyltransferase
MNPFEQGLTRYLKPEQLKAIQAQRIGIAGAGGLGSNVAVALVRTGFKNFEILDRDVVDASNLNRQDYISADIGKPKVELLTARLKAINPDVFIVTNKAEWTRANAGSFFQGFRILVEAFDKAEVKRDFVEWASVNAGVVISGNGMAGLTGTGTPQPLRSAHYGAATAGLTGGDPTSIKHIGNIYIVGDGTTSITDGHPPLAPRVLQCAAKMAEVILRLTLELPII